MEISKHSHLQDLNSLPFCYLCGKLLPAPGPDRNRDHVPPKAVFLRADTKSPLILPTHTVCNHAESLSDVEIAQLIGVLHGLRYSRREQKLRVAVLKDPLGEVGIITIDLKRIIWRWVRGFHAALYREPLPIDAGKQIQPPLAEAVPGKLGIVPRETLDQQPEIVEIIQRSRAAGRLDRIVTRAGKCIYECVWIQFDGGERQGCVFALQLYDWADLGETQRTGRRGCSGFYWIENPPTTATFEVRVKAEERNVTGRLDPFE